MKYKVYGVSPEGYPVDVEFPASQEKKANDYAKELERKNYSEVTVVDSWSNTDDMLKSINKKGYWDKE